MHYIRTANPKELRGVALLRLDFNTEDEWRMEVALPTIKFLLKTAGKVVIVSHRGRPKKFESKLSLKKDAVALRKFLGRKIRFVPHFRFAKIKNEIEKAPNGSIFLLDNLRFMPGEAKNDRKFAKNLASLADFYVNDAFPVSHREAASVVAITKFLPSYGGLLMEQEIIHLTKALHAAHPLVVVVGGAKAHDKLGVIRFLRRKTSWFLIGGASANTLLHLTGLDVQKSAVDEDKKDLRELKEVLTYKNVLMPVDWKMDQGRILDIGDKTAEVFAKHVKQARTIIWSGPLGYIENERFAQGTLKVARAIAANRKAFSVTGGGETVMFLKKHKIDKRFSFISTGGGAMVDFLAGRRLPGIEALKGGLARRLARKLFA